MSRSRPRLIRPRALLLAIVAAALLAAPSFAFAATPPDWSPKLGYVLTTGSVRAALVRKLHLSKRQDDRLRLIGWDLYEAQEAVQRRSDLVVMSDSLTLGEKRAIVGHSGYNGTLASAEESAAVRAAAAAGMTPSAFADAVTEVWQEDAATHRLETELTALGLTPQAVAGSFHVYATRFTDQYGTAYGVAVPDKYVKFANLGYSRPAGYPAGLYAVSLYWDGVHRGRDGNLNQVVTSPRSVASAKVVDVGPWNTDDNWWNSYTDPQRPRRINSPGISYHDVATGGGGPDFLVGKPKLAFGLPESQAAYFNYYARPSRIPAHSTSWENYWDKPRGYNGQWSGADQFGRQVTQPAAIDLTPPVAHDLGMSRDTNGDGKDDYYDNEWIDVVPLWEANLTVVGSIKVTPGPYITGQKVTYTFTVKNTGTLTGTWSSISFRTKDEAGTCKDCPAQGPITLGPGATKTLSFGRGLQQTGTLTGYPRMSRAGIAADIPPATVTLPNVLSRAIDRAAGGTRYDTAIAISKAAYPGTSHAVVIATGNNYPDALAGAALARSEDGPILLVGDGLATSVKAELQRLHPSKVLILGGEASISAAAAFEIASAVPSAETTRIAGWNRYATARLIAERVAARNGGKVPDGTAIVATGRDFADALGASPLSAKRQWPILLTEPGRLPTDTAAALAEIGATNTVVLGGEASVGSPVLASLPAPSRIAGSDRYDTAARLGDLAEAKGLSYAYVGLSVGSAYPDALAGGVLAASRNGVMLLTRGTSLSPQTRDRLARHRTVTTHLQAYGSSRSLSDGVLRAAEDALR